MSKSIMQAIEEILETLLEENKGEIRREAKPSLFEQVSNINEEEIVFDPTTGEIQVVSNNPLQRRETVVVTQIARDGFAIL